MTLEELQQQVDKDFKLDDTELDAESKTDMPIKEWSDCPNLKYITQKEMAQRLYN